MRDGVVKVFMFIKPKNQIFGFVAFNSQPMEILKFTNFNVRLGMNGKLATISSKFNMRLTLSCR